MNNHHDGEAPEKGRGNGGKSSRGSFPFLVLLAILIVDADCP